IARRLAHRTYLPLCPCPLMETARSSASGPALADILLENYAFYCFHILPSVGWARKRGTALGAGFRHCQTAFTGTDLLDLRLHSEPDQTKEALWAVHSSLLVSRSPTSKLSWSCGS